MADLKIVRVTLICFLVLLAIQVVAIVVAMMRKQRTRGDWAFLGLLGLASCGVHNLGITWLTPVIEARVLAVIAGGFGLIELVRALLSRVPITAQMLMLFSIACFTCVVFLQAVPAIAIACVLTLVFIASSTVLALRDVLVAPAQAR